MNDQLPVPYKGQQLKASWGAGVASRLNGLCKMNPHGALARDGVTGQGDAPLPANLRDRRGSAAARAPGRFEIVSIAADETDDESQEKTYTVSLRNCYYDVGGKTYEAQGVDEDGVLSIDGVADGDIVALKVGSAEERTDELICVSGLSSLQGEQDKLDFYTLPLYLVANGNVTCDFRTGPCCSMGEF